MCYCGDMDKRLLIKPVFASLLVAALPACGDSGGGSTSDPSAATFTSGNEDSDANPTTTTGFTPTDTGDDTTGVVDPSTTTSGEPMTTTDTGDDTTTGTPGDCQAPADGADEDMDGVANMADNCRCDPNPNQLDFDGNAVGNVCDEPLLFTLADGVPPDFNRLASTASAGMAIFKCSFGVDLVVVNGEVEVSLDDNGLGKFYAKRINFADTPEYECDLTLFKVKLRIEDFFTDGPDPFVVGFPFTVADHANGTVNGMTDSPHAILISGIINVTESGNPDIAPTGPNPIEMVPGEFPLGQVTVANQGEQLSVVFNDADSIVFMQTTMGGIEIEMKGLNGTMRLKK